MKSDIPDPLADSPESQVGSVNTICLQRRNESMMRLRLLVIVAVVIVVAACGSDRRESDIDNAVRDVVDCFVDGMGEDKETLTERCAWKFALAIADICGLEVAEVLRLDQGDSDCMDEMAEQLEAELDDFRDLLL